MSKNLKAFLDMIAISELGEKLIARSDNGYNVLVGGALFHNGYKDHPRIVVDLPRLKIKSTAAGRYQILARIYDHYKKELKLPDFSPRSQDLIAVQLIRECKAVNDIDAGRIEDAITKCRSRWASLPGAGYGQHEHKMEHLLAAYIKSGGLRTIV
jgi:muramidase (phage lysozyme)